VVCDGVALRLFVLSTQCVYVFRMVLKISHSFLLWCCTPSNHSDNKRVFPNKAFIGLLNGITLCFIWTKNSNLYTVNTYVCNNVLFCQYAARYKCTRKTVSIISCTLNSALEEADCSARYYDNFICGWRSPGTYWTWCFVGSRVGLCAF